MKRILPLLITLPLIITIACTSEEKCEEIDFNKELAQVENVLEKYVMANENQNFSMIEEIWAEDEDIMLLGTDSDEIYVGWKSIKKAIQHQFKEFEDTYISVTKQKIRINASGNTAWFSEHLNYNFIYQGEAKSFSGIRFTGVMEKRNEKWVLVQVHLSIPVDVGTETGG